MKSEHDFSNAEEGNFYNKKASFKFSIYLEIEPLQSYLMAKPGTTKERPFGPVPLVYKVLGKIYAIVAQDEDPLHLSLKCDPDEALFLRDLYTAVSPGYHLNKTHWNTIVLDLPACFLLAAELHSADTVASVKIYKNPHQPTVKKMRPTLNLLSPNLITKILDEAKRVLAETGIEVRGAALHKRLLDAGLPTDLSGERVLFPRDVVEQAIADAPQSFDLFDRDGNRYTTIGGDAVHFTPASSGLKILDHRTGQTRLAHTADFAEYVRLANQLEHIAYLATAFSTNDDIEPDVSDAWRLYLCLTQSKKPIVSGAFTEHGVTRMAEMMQLFRRDRQELLDKPMSIFTITATGNFRYSEDSCQNLLDCVEWGIPIEIVPVTLMGLIAPVTLVGAAVFHTVDVLAGITMAQLVRPGAPVLFGGAPAAFHMKEASSPMLGIDALRLDLAYVEIAQHLNLPTQSYMALSDSKFLDAQAGAETFGSAMLAALAGINSVSGPGMLDFVMVFSLAKLVHDNDLCGQALHLVRPVDVVDDLPVDGLIDELRREQHLITAPHTLAHWQEQLFMPHAVTDRSNRENWEKRGAQTLQERANTAVSRYLNSYQPIQTDPAIDRAMRDLIRGGLSDKSRQLPVVPEHKVTKAAVSPTRKPKRKRRRGVQ